MVLIFLSCAWVAGVLAGSDRSLPWGLVLATILPLPLLAFRPQWRSRIILVSLGLFAFFAAASYAYASLHTSDEGQLRYYNDRADQVRGIVSGDPEVRENSQSLKVAASGVRTEAGWRAVKGTAMVTLPRYPEYRYGDEIALTGKLEIPRGGEDFDYRAYLARQGIYSAMSYPRVQALGADRGSPLLALVYRLRDRLSVSLHRALPEPQAALAEGIVLGRRGLIPASVSADFSRSGTAHILAISGANLTIVTGILVAAGLWLFGRRRYIYVWLTLGMVWFYTLLTGFNPPVVRAAIMASIFLVAEILGRQRHGITALALSAAVMVGISPFILGDLGFQMSFLSMAGLVLFYPRLSAAGQALAARLPGSVTRPSSGIFNSLAASLASLLGIWPLVALNFGIVSVVGPAATLLALPALPGVIISGIATALSGLFWLPLAQAAGSIVWMLASYLMLVAGGMAALPFSFYAVERVPAGAIAAYYAALAFLIWARSRKALLISLPGRVRPSLAPLGRLWRPALVLPPLFILAGLSTTAAASMPDDRVHVYFLDVGEGDAVLVQRGSQQVLIDGGPNAAVLARALGARMPFWDRTIEVVVSSHPHADHLTGLIETLRRYRVETVLEGPGDYASPVRGAWEAALKDAAPRRETARAGMVLDMGGDLSLRVLAPGAEPLTGTESDVDNNSVVLRLSAGRVSFLFAGDIMGEAERELRHGANLGSTVLKVSHHGSRTSTSLDFLAAVNPALAVISAGAGNSFGHPHGEVVGRLAGKTGAANIYRTDRQGTAEFITDGKGLWVRTER